MVYVFLANGFEEIEALTPVDYLRRCEIEVKTIGIGGKTITGSHGISVVCDDDESGINPKDIDMIVLPGGMPGTLNLEKSEAVRHTIEFCHENDIYIAAICAAPSILGHMGLLKGKNAVCYPGFEDQIIGANIKDTPVCRDGKIITAKGAGAANQFAFELITVLCSQDRANLLKAAIQWKE